MARQRSSRPARVGCPRPDKVRFTEDAARRAAAVMRADLHAPDIDAYECVCGSWHVGNQPSLTAKIARALGADQ